MKAKRLNQIFSCSLVFVHHQTLLAIVTYDSINDILYCQELLDCEYCPEVMGVDDNSAHHPCLFNAMPRFKR